MSSHPDLDAAAPQRYPTLAQWIYCERADPVPAELVRDCIRLTNDPHIAMIKEAACRLFGSLAWSVELLDRCVAWLCLERGLSECEAGQTLLADLATHLSENLRASPPAGVLVRPAGVTTIWYHGGQSYSAHGQTPVLVPAEQHNALRAFLDRDEALDTAALERKGVCNPSAVIARLAAKFGSGAVRQTGGDKGSGYYVRVRSKAN